MADSRLKNRTAKGLLWGGIGNGALQLLNLVFGIFLARLLSPSDYGTVGALAIFSAIAGLLCESGFISGIRQQARNLGIGTIMPFSGLMWWWLL